MVYTIKNYILRLMQILGINYNVIKKNVAFLLRRIGINPNIIRKYLILFGMLNIKNFHDFYLLSQNSNKVIKKRFYSSIYGDFKWPYYTPTFASVFMGTNDYGRIKDLDFLFDALEEMRVEKSEVDLYTLIGGMYFFDFLSRRKFNKITLFDSNIMEHTKISLVVNYLLNLKYMHYDRFNSLDDFISSNPSKFYMPNMSKGQHDIIFDESAKWEYDGIYKPYYSLLSPNYFPNFSWNPTETDYINVTSSLKEDLSQEIFFNIPDIDAEGRITLIYLSNVFFDTNTSLNEEFVTKKVKNSPLVIPIYSEYEKGITLDAHACWEFVLKKLIKGSTLHIWSPEDRDLKESHLDEMFTSSTVIDKFISDNTICHYNTVILHIILGRKDNNILLKDRIELLSKALLNASSICNRLIICEFNSKASSHSHRNDLLDLKQIISLCQQNLSQYKLTEVRYAPGNKDLKRNAFICFDKKQNI